MQAAPSLRVEALPAVTVPPSRKTGRSFASFSAEASGRGPSSASTRTVSRPLRRLDRDDLLGQLARLGRGDGALVAAQGEGVLVLAADPVALGDVLAGLAHRLGGDAELGHPRVDHPPAEGRVVHRLRAAGEGALGLLDHPGRPAHRLDPAGQVEVALAGLDRPGGAVDRLQAGGAEAVDGRAGHALRQAGEQRRHPGDVAVVLAGLVGGAEVDVGDPLGVDAAALDHGGDRVRGEVVGADAGEGAAVGAHRGAQRVRSRRPRASGANRILLGCSSSWGPWRYWPSWSACCCSSATSTRAAPPSLRRLGARPARPRSRRRTRSTTSAR